MMRFLCCLWCVFCYCNSLSRSEYLVRSGQIPSYLEASYRLVDDNIFPSKITINVVITKFAGTLLHAIDYRGNEVCILLKEEKEIQFITLWLNSKNSKVNLNQLCSCGRSCTSIQLTLIIKTHSLLSLQCNKRLPEILKLTGNETRKKNSTVIEGTEVKGMIWLVNTPSIGRLQSNPHQMEGRILNVEYRGNFVSLKAYGDAIVDRNKVACNNKMVCNGGICHETHSDEPLCDCTKIFGSGPTCLDDSQTINRKFNHTFQFGGIKISWRSESSKIFEIGNERRKLQVKEDKTDLMFISTADNIRVPLMNDYVKNKNYVVLISFDEIGITTQLVNHSTTRMSIRLNLNQEIFDYMTLSSGKGVIDVAYKVNMSELSWKKWELKHEVTEIPKIIAAEYTTSRTVQENHGIGFRQKGQSYKSDQDQSDKKSSLVIVIVTSVTANVFFLISLIIVLLKIRRIKAMVARTVSTIRLNNSDSNFENF